MRKCSVCKVEKSLESFYKCKTLYLGYNYTCKECYKIYSNVYIKKPEIRFKRNKCSREKTLEIKKVVLAHYGNKCVCCGETEEVFLALDHINNDGNIQRKLDNRNSQSLYRKLIKLNYPNDIQILCMNCNWAKFRGVCPHSLVIKGNNV